MAELDDIIHQPLRLRIMAALNALPAGEGLEFSRLKKLTGATDGNLGAHIETLAKCRLCRGRKGLCRQEAANDGHRDRGRPRRVRPACRDAPGDHRGVRRSEARSPLRPVGVLCDRQRNCAGCRWRSHENTFAGFRRPRTRSRVEDRGLSAGDETLVRARQCRHRARSRMRGARYRRPRRGDRFLPAPEGRSGRGRPGDAARRRHCRRSFARRHQGVRAEQAGGAA